MQSGFAGYALKYAKLAVKNVKNMIACNIARIVLMLVLNAPKNAAKWLPLKLAENKDLTLAG
ncbi:MAG: hypothetical protein WD597_09690 [Balneolaceae bacterium]